MEKNTSEISERQVKKIKSEIKQITTLNSAYHAMKLREGSSLEMKSMLTEMLTDIIKKWQIKVKKTS